MKLAGKVALVTGGSRGIGKSIVWALAREGAKVAFVYRSNAEAADTLVSDLELDQREVIAHKADVSKKEGADGVVEQVLEHWEKIDILVNNAGIIRDGLLATMDQDQWQQVINTNLNSVYNFCRAVTRSFGPLIDAPSEARQHNSPPRRQPVFRCS